MPRESQSEITFDGLKQFLCDIGFEQPVKIENSLAFQHDTGTIVLLSIPDDGRTVRPADLLSVLMRLEHQGLIGDAALKQFRSGVLPKAS